LADWEELKANCPKLFALSFWGTKSATVWLQFATQMRAAILSSQEIEETELQCDSEGLKALLFFDEKYSVPFVVETEEGPDVDFVYGLNKAWTVFEQLALGLFFGDALRLRVEGFLHGTQPEPFSLAERRCEALIAKFRASNLNTSEVSGSARTFQLLEQAFIEIDALVRRTVDLEDERFTTTCGRLAEGDLSWYSVELQDRFFERLAKLGITRGLGGCVLLPEMLYSGSELERQFHELDCMEISGSRLDRGPTFLEQSSGIAILVV